MATLRLDQDFHVVSQSTYSGGHRYSRSTFLELDHVIHDVTQVLTLLRRTRVLGIKRMVRMGAKPTIDKQLHAKLWDFGVKAFVESKKNFLLGQRQGFLGRSLRLYKTSPGLWKHTFRFHKKATVEHVFGLVKLRNPLLRARKRINKHKHLLTAFLLYNLNLLLTHAQTGGN